MEYNEYLDGSFNSKTSEFDSEKAKKNVLIFVVQSEGKNYLIQLDADKRDDYLIGGMVYKKL